MLTFHDGHSVVLSTPHERTYHRTGLTDPLQNMTGILFTSKMSKIEDG